MWGAAVVALAVCVLLSLACGRVRCTSAAVAAAWLYNLRLKATALSWLPYVAGFGALPAAVALSLPGGPAPRWWTVAAGGPAAGSRRIWPTRSRTSRWTGRPESEAFPHRLGDTGTRLLLPLSRSSVRRQCSRSGHPERWDAAGAAALVLAGAAAIAGPALGRRWRKAALAGAVAVAAADVALLLVGGVATG
ncbi:membrane protein [Streptomyces badius]